MNSIVSGAFILFITWLFFNGASGGTLIERKVDNQPARIVFNTIIAASAGAVVAFFFKPFMMSGVEGASKYGIIDVVGGLLSGLVSMTAGCNNVASYSALIIGGIGALFYILGCRLMVRFKIDDPLESI